jgi:hypothetical protein
LAGAQRYEQVPPGRGEMLLAEARDPTSVNYRLRVSSQAAGWNGSVWDSPYALSVRLFVPDAWQAGVRDWLDQEHYAAMLGVAGCHWYLGYESLAGRFNFLNLWGLDAPAVIDAPAWAAARDTPWRGRLMPAFADTARAVYRRLR